MKKKMYYNMRIKTLKRNTTNVIKRAKRALSARVSFILNDYSALRRRYKDVVREREEIFMAELGERPPETQQKLDELGGALEVLANAMEEKLDQIRRIKVCPPMNMVGRCLSVPPSPASPRQGSSICATNFSPSQRKTFPASSWS